MAQVVTRILVGFREGKQPSFPGWHSKRQWPPINSRPHDPNVTYYVSNPHVLPGRRS